LVTANDITNGKPHPDPYLKGASKLGFSPSDCVVLEDVPAGVRSGKTAGAKVIAFTTTVESAVLRRSGADWVLQSCADITLAAPAEPTRRLSPHHLRSDDKKLTLSLHLPG
jgi:beta-phosphoglucomutase-like phosphatase (HAD superfamily)